MNHCVRHDYHDYRGRGYELLSHWYCANDVQPLVCEFECERYKQTDHNVIMIMFLYRYAASCTCVCVCLCVRIKNDNKHGQKRSMKMSLTVLCQSLENRVHDC